MKISIFCVFFDSAPHDVLKSAFFTLTVLYPYNINYKDTFLHQSD